MKYVNNPGRYREETGEKTYIKTVQRAKSILLQQKGIRQQVKLCVHSDKCEMK